MESDKTAHAKDFVEVQFSGFANGQLFDSNIPEDLKKLDEKAKPEKTVIALGEKMLVPGLDKQLEGKEIGKEYEIHLKAKEGFGDRNRNLLKIIPLKAFHEQKVDPRPGMMFTLDNALVKIVAVSGARVTADFNNPLSGKDLMYKITMVRKVEDAKEKSEAMLKYFLRFTPEFEVNDKIVVKGPKILESILNIYNDKFKELVGKELAFEEKKEDKKEHKEEKHEHVQENKTKSE